MGGGGGDIQGEISFRKPRNLWVAKALMSSYILGTILSFQTRVAQNVFNVPLSNYLGQLIVLSPYDIQTVPRSETNSFMLTKNILHVN